MQATWNVNYRRVSLFDQMLMPPGIADIESASMYGTELLSQPIHLDQSQVDIASMVAFYMPFTQ